MKRIYQKQGNGMAVPTSFGMCEQTGKVSPLALTTQSKVAKTSKLRAAGFPVMDDSQIQSCMNGNEQFAVVGAETAQGVRTNVRVESSRKIGGGRNKRLTVTLTNTSTTNAHSVLIGDYSQIIEGAAAIGGLGVGPKPADITVGGKFGTSTLDIIKRVSGPAPYDLHGVYIVATKTVGGAPDEDFRSDGKFQFVKAQVNGDTPTVDTYELLPLVKANAENRNIYEINDLRERLGAYEACLVNIPAGVKLAISFIINAAGTGAVMEEV